MRAIGSAAAFLALLATAPPAASQRASVRVEHAGPGLIQASPGQRVTAVFRVTRGSAADPIRVTPHFPAGWPGITTAADTSRSFVHLVPLSVPADARAGRHVVRLSAEARSGRASDSVVIVVPEVRAVALAVTGAPRFAAAGTSYEVTARLSNRGNAPVRVRVTGEAPRGFTPRVSSPEIALAPRTSAEVRVTVSTPAGLNEARVSLVQLRAVVLGDSARSEAVSRVQVIPRGGRAPRHHLPVTLGVRAGAPGGGIPLTVSASGPLRPAGRTYVDFSYRGRGAAAPEVGERDELQFVLRSAGVKVRAGDHFWSLSQLTEPGITSFGAGVQFGGGSITAGGFGQRNRRVPGSPLVAGARVEAGRPTLGAHANLLRRGSDSTTVSGGLRIRPLRGVLLEGEYGAGLGAAAGTRGVDGRLTAESHWGSVQTRVLRTDPGFPGTQGGRRALYAGATLRPYEGVRIYGSLDDQRRVRPEFVEDTVIDLPHPYLPEHTDRSRFLRIGADLRGLSLSSQDGVWDAAGGDASERRSRSVTGSTRIRRGPLSLGTGLEAGVIAAGVEEAPFRRAWIRAGLALRGSAFASASVERYDVSGSGNTSVAGESRLAGTLHLNTPLGRSTRLGLMTQAAFDPEGRIGSGYVDASIEQRIRGGYTLSLRTRRNEAATDRSWKMWLDVAVPLRLTTSLRPAPGSVGGRVLNASGGGVANALVRAGGRAALTDERGNWSIAGLTPGRHVVEVDPLTAGLGTLPAQRDALEVDLTDRGARVDVSLVQSARLAGTLTRFDPPPFSEGGDPRPVGGVAFATIELRSGGEVVYESTDAAGRFAFSGLRPGRWVLRVAEEDLPDRTSVQPDSLVLDLEPGADQEAHLRALPVTRVLRIVAGGDLVLGAPAVERTSAGSTALNAPASSAEPVRDSSRLAAAPVNAGQSRTAGRRVLGQPVPTRPTITRITVEVPDEGPDSEPNATGIRDWVDDRYTVWPGDRDLPAIAGLVYADETLWPKLWLANRSRMASPYRVTPGMVLVIPPKAPLTAAERRAAGEFPRGRPRR